MTTIARKLTRQRVWALCSFVVIAGLFFVTRSAVALEQGPASGEHLITVYDHGIERTFVSNAHTVKEALGRVGISIQSADSVEPKANTELVAKNYRVNVYRARPVLVVDGATRNRIMTAEQSPQRIVEASGSKLYDEDITRFERVDDIVSDGGAGLRLVIDRATVFQFTQYGKTFEARTQAKTVGDMLKEKGIVLGAQDGTSLPLSTPITGGMSVSVWRNGKQTITQEEVIAKPTEEVKDADQAVGYRALKTQGTDGKKNVTYEIEMRDGKEIGRTVVASVTTLEPIKEVVTVGTKLTNTFSGSFAEALARLRSCEAGGNYDRNSGNGYYGAYQYDISTWGGYGGYARADLAPPNVQDEKVWETYQRRGWQPWPSCKVKMGLQDIYR